MATLCKSYWKQSQSSSVKHLFTVNWTTHKLLNSFKWVWFAVQLLSLTSFLVFQLRSSSVYSSSSCYDRLALTKRLAIPMHKCTNECTRDATGRNLAICSANRMPPKTNLSVARLDCIYLGIRAEATSLYFLRSRRARELQFNAAALTFCLCLLVDLGYITLFYSAPDIVLWCMPLGVWGETQTLL